MRIRYRLCGTCTYALRYVDSRIILHNIHEIRYALVATPKCNSLSHLYIGHSTHTHLHAFAFGHSHERARENICIHTLSVNEPLKLDGFAIYIFMHRRRLPEARNDCSTWQCHLTIIPRKWRQILMGCCSSRFERTILLVAL